MSAAKRVFVLGDSITVGYGPFLKALVHQTAAWSYSRKNGGGDGSDMSNYGKKLYSYFTTTAAPYT